MCWLYGNTENCYVCKRIQQNEKNAGKNVSTSTKSNPHFEGFTTEITLPETSRLAANYYLKKAIFNIKEEERKKDKTGPQTLDVCNEHMWNRLFKRKTPRQSIFATEIGTGVPLAHARLFRFMAVLSLFNTVHWSNIRFPPNEQMLKRMTATHLALIVGKSEYQKHKTELLGIISRKMNLSLLTHIVWITNRQNGKTTTLSKFLAAMAIMGVSGGPLMYVYSTNRDRAVELVDGAKRYINEAKDNPELKKKFQQIGVNINPYEVNNTVGFAMRSSSDESVINVIKARPKTADSCRGDAPHACVFDEVGFVTGDFWYQFAFPLIQVGARVFTMATTPAHSGTFFADFTNDVIRANGEGNYLFYLINHSLVCDMCKENGDDACCHRLGNIPSWKPVTGFNKMKQLVPDKRQDDFQKEIFGMIKEENLRFFPEKWINHFFNFENAKEFENVSTKSLDLFISIDPPSHSESCMGLCAIVYSGDATPGDNVIGGTTYIVGQAEVGVLESQMIELSTLVVRFTLKVLEQLISLDRPAKNIRVLPIVECNNNEFQSNTLMKKITEAAVMRGAKPHMPFKSSAFKKNISEHIGVWTTQSTKLAGIQCLVNMMQDKRIWVWNQCVTIGKVFLKRHMEPTTKIAIQVLRDELIQFKSTDKGPSGKSSSTNDDSAMALLNAVYWSYCIRAFEMYK